MGVGIKQALSDSSFVDAEDENDEDSREVELGLGKHGRMPEKSEDGRKDRLSTVAFMKEMLIEVHPSAIPCRND